MPAVKLDTKPSASAADAIAPWAGELYRTPGMHLVGLVELAHVERTQPAPGEDKEPSVKLRITSLELANEAMEEPIRRALRAMYLTRTAYGTLDEAGLIQLDDGVVERLGGDIMAHEAARLRVGAERWAEHAYRVTRIDNITVTELLHELTAIADGLRAAVRGAATEVEER